MCKIYSSSPDYEEINYLTLLLSSLINKEIQYKYAFDQDDDIIKIELSFDEIEEIKAGIKNRLQEIFDFQKLSFNDEIVKKNIERELTWEEKGEWLRSHGYIPKIEPMNVGGMDFDDEYDKWLAHIEGEWRVYGKSIPEVVSKIYDVIQRGYLE